MTLTSYSVLQYLVPAVSDRVLVIIISLGLNLEDVSST